MRGKIVLAVLSFISFISIGLIVLLLNVTPITLHRQTFSFQINDSLPTEIEYYVKANDNILENSTLHIEEVDPSIMAIYPAYVTYKDQRFDFQVMIEDKEKPILTLKGKSAIVTCYIGQSFKAVDLVDVVDDTTTTVYFEDKTTGERTEYLTLKKEQNIDYYIVAVDSVGNVSKKQRVRFEVGTDTSKPTISGIANVTLKIGDSFDVLAGVKAIDNVDEDITSMLVVSPKEIDTTKPGQYTITYSVTDLSGNKETQTRIVTVTESGVSGQVDVGDGGFLTESQVATRDSIVQSLLTSELDDYDDYQFFTNLNKYLMNHYSRTTSSQYDSSYSVIVQERGTHMAMVRAVKVILDARGIENVIVYGSKDGMVWNLVKIDNTYRHIDIYANAIYKDEQHCFLLKTSELDENYEYDTTRYPLAN